MSAESEAAFLVVLDAYRENVLANPGADSAGLESAALDHVRASRPVAEVAAEYAAANAGSASAARAQELAQELNSVRMAQAIVDGSLPYRPPVVTTGN